MLFVQLHRQLAAALLLVLFALPLSAVIAQPAAGEQDAVSVYGYRVLNSFPHNENFFTQGLLIHQGELYEGTGRNGESALLHLDMKDGSVIKSRQLPSRYFGEGIAVAGERIFQLTWRENMVFVYDLESFSSLESHYWPREGWGLSYDGEQLILSDGSDQLFFLDPGTFRLLRQVPVRLQGRPVSQLNELEYIDGEIWANVWMSQQIVRINPQTGQVTGVVDLTGLVNQTRTGGSEAVLNGIAWNADTRQLFVTGKLWSHIFEIELVDP
jgi:glutaminyl-peptide cyclotransferase